MGVSASDERDPPGCRRRSRCRRWPHCGPRSRCRPLDVCHERATRNGAARYLCCDQGLGSSVGYPRVAASPLDAGSPSLAKMASRRAPPRMNPPGLASRSHRRLTPGTLQRRNSSPPLQPLKPACPTWKAKPPGRVDSPSRLALISAASCMWPTPAPTHSEKESGGAAPHAWLAGRQMSSMLRGMAELWPRKASPTGPNPSTFTPCLCVRVCVSLDPEYVRVRARACVFARKVYTLPP